MTTIEPREALKLIARGKLTFDETVVVNRVVLKVGTIADYRMDYTFGTPP